MWTRTGTLAAVLVVPHEVTLSVRARVPEAWPAGWEPAEAQPATASDAAIRIHSSSSAKRQGLEDCRDLGERWGPGE